jgi:hypothetical protein
MSDDRHIAIHEAGHAVAHVRLNVDRGDVHIIPDKTTNLLGAAQGSDSVWNEQDARDQILCLCRLCRLDRRRV